jgi:major histocompatibility complex class I
MYIGCLSLKVGFKIAALKPGVVVHAFNPSTWEAEAGKFLSSRPTWSIE